MPEPPNRIHQDARPDAPAATPRSWFRQVTFHSLLAGLCPLIPVPFLDDRVLAAVRRKMVRELAVEREVVLDPERVDVLAGVGRERRGCLGTVAWIAFSLTVRLLGKLFRKILIVFAVKESVDTASRVFHEGYLLHLGLGWARHWGDGAVEALGVDRALGLRQVVERTVAEADPRPVEQVLRRGFRGSRGLLRRAAGVLRRSAGRGDGAAGPLPESEERRLLGGLLDTLVAELWEEQGYLSALEVRFRAHLEESAERPPGPEPASPDAPGS